MNRLGMWCVTVAFWSTTGFSWAAELNLVTEGASEYRIVVPDNGGKVVAHAAEEFQRLLKEMTGANLPIVPESTAGSGPAVLIGVGKRVERLGLQREAAKLAVDGVLLKSVGPDLVLLGQNGRGQVYAVYELFERYLGVKFLAGDCTVMPQKKTVGLPSLDYSYAPPFLYRHIWAYDCMNPYIKGHYAPVLAQRLRLGGTLQQAPEAAGGCVWTKPFSHSFNEMMPADKYYADHPECFALLNGKRVRGVVNAQLCLTNPNVLRICTQKVLQWCAEDPGPEVIISICPNDGAGWCECEKCAAVFKDEGSQMGPVLRFANAIADEVARKYPGKQLCVFPYAAATRPPAHTRPRENVWAYFCHGGCYFHGFEECDLGTDLKQLLDRWRELMGGRLFFHQYMTNFGHYLAPNQNLNGLVKDIRYIAAHGVKGVSVQGQWNCPGGELIELRTYLVAKLLWNPDTDVMTIRREFCRGYYGSASDDVLGYLDLLDAMAAGKTIHGFGNWDPSRTVKPEFVVEGLKVLDAARRKADGPATRRRVEKLLPSLWYMQLGWPDRYNLNLADAPKIVTEFRRIATENDVTHIHESIDYTFQNLRWEPNMSHWLDSMTARYALAGDKSVVFDLGAALLSQAKCENCADWRWNIVDCNGQKRAAIFHHPPEHGFGDATYELHLPKIETGKKHVLKFGTVITAASVDGVRFAVLVDGRELWNLVETEHLSPAVRENTVDPPSANAFKEHLLDLMEWADKTVKLTLRVSAVGNSNYDWSNWVQPHIAVGESHE